MRKFILMSEAGRFVDYAYAYAWREAIESYNHNNRFPADVAFYAILAE